MRSETITWHPASEPPDTDRWVLVTSNKRETAVIGRFGGGGQWVNSIDVPVLEWCDLPKPPEPEPEWITPNDEHARSRPACEVKYAEDKPWYKGRELLAVVDKTGFPFVVIENCDDGNDVQAFAFCRIRKPAPAPEPQEVWIAPSHDLYLGIAYKSKQQAEVCSLPGTKLLRATIHGEATE